MKKLIGKILLTSFLVIAMSCLLAMTFSASAETIVGDCGENLTWTLDTESGLLKIEGEGEMTADPWQDYYECVTKVVIGDGVTSIIEGAFNLCYALNDITISDSVTRIGQRAFENTEYYNNQDNMENGCLYIGNHLITNSFLEGTYDIYIKDGTKVIADYAFPKTGYSFGMIIPEIIIPDSVTHIGSGAFTGCFYLTTVYIPDSVVFIAEDSFNALKGNLDTFVSPIVSLYYEGSEEQWLQVTENKELIGSYVREYNYEYNNHDHSFASEIPDYQNQSPCVLPHWVSMTCDCGWNVWVLNYEPTGNHDCIYEYEILPCTINEETVTRRIKICKNERCSKVFEDIEVTVQPTEHSMSEWTVDTQATCMKAGQESRYCTYGCGYTETREVTAPHTMGEWTVEAAATCTSPGTESRSCTYSKDLLNRCNYTETREIPKIDHNMSDWSTETVANCMSEGVESRYCTYYCGKIERKAIPVIEHSMTEWLDVFPATCTDSGKQYRYCVYGCGHQEYNEITATGHKDSDRNGFCDNCGTELEKNKTVWEKIIDFFKRIINWFRNLFR